MIMQISCCKKWRIEKILNKRTQHNAIMLVCSRAVFLYASMNFFLHSWRRIKCSGFLLAFFTQVVLSFNVITFKSTLVNKYLANAYYHSTLCIEQ